jgi:hypothetical protein
MSGDPSPQLGRIDSPCRICGLPVVAASFGGRDVCPWCDMGMFRDGTRWSYAETMNLQLIRERAREFGMEGPRLPTRKLGVYMRVLSPEGVREGFIPFAPDTLEPSDE